MISLNDFYGFTHTPFSKSTPAKDLYPSRGHSRWLAPARWPPAQC